MEIMVNLKDWATVCFKRFVFGFPLIVTLVYGLQKKQVIEFDNTMVDLWRNKKPEMCILLYLAYWDPLKSVVVQ